MSARKPPPNFNTSKARATPDLTPHLRACPGCRLPHTVPRCSPHYPCTAPQPLAPCVLLPVDTSLLPCCPSLSTHYPPALAYAGPGPTPLSPIPTPISTRLTLPHLPHPTLPQPDPNPTPPHPSPTAPHAAAHRTPAPHSPVHSLMFVAPAVSVVRPPGHGEQKNRPRSGW